MKNSPLFSTLKAYSLLVLGVLIGSCTWDTQSNCDTATKEQVHNELAKWEQDIELNQGAPWRANKATSVGIVNMYGIIVESAPIGLNDYQVLADALSQEMTRLINRCTMSGPSHDNLHVYLEPLLGNLAELKETQSAEQGKRLLGEIQEHLMVYNKYFV